LNTVPERDCNNLLVAMSGSQSRGSVEFSDAFSTIMAWGRTGWLEDFSRAAAAQSTSFSNTLSMVLGAVSL
jgi:hypothetical protein